LTSTGKNARNNPMKTHSFLFREGLWSVEGVYFDDSGRSIPLEGKTRVTHLPRLWVNEGALELKPAEGSIVIHSRYEVTPFEEGLSTTSWKSSNPAVGELTGSFILVDDAILSVCRSGDGLFGGSEFILRVDDEQYLNRGAFLRKNERLSSWSVILRKIKDGPFPESV